MKSGSSLWIKLPPEFLDARIQKIIKQAKKSYYPFHFFLDNCFLLHYAKHL
jgi:hypothetical protein